MITIRSCARHGLGYRFMNRLKFKMFSSLLVVVLMLSTASCDPDPEVTIDSVVTGTANATPSYVQNGDSLTLSIKGISISSYSEVNGKGYYPVVHYLIDGVEVAISSEKGQPFTAIYIVENLTKGEHTLSVNIKPSRSGANFRNAVSPSTIMVTE